MNHSPILDDGQRARVRLPSHVRCRRDVALALAKLAPKTEDPDGLVWLPEILSELPQWTTAQVREALDRLSDEGLTRSRLGKAEMFGGRWEIQAACWGRATTAAEYAERLDAVGVAQ
jgi:hypothetical protein